mmetsp:Transcript_17427/g.29419  ORF Transcript_17427/g.29419 Transcript_17427/m.29419 type:complete len:85 (+) Transcript_17427:510-764(+)
MTLITVPRIKVTALSHSTAATIRPWISFFAHFLDNPIRKSSSMSCGTIVCEEKWLDMLIFKCTCIKPSHKFADTITTTYISEQR